ncbi:hypothetical protein [Luteolibacter pohnpeiensis]|uniref:hypothetical protein n=1 Tax=Luteolibacter pohnpeiensis TaxID=454153 RepID=UPI0019036E93|nr:hypothetical protein [Luteolibacter pohnpeiensis]
MRFFLILIAILLTVFSFPTAKGEEADSNEEIVVENGKAFLNVRRNFDFNGTPLPEVIDYIRILAAEHWNRLIESGRVKNAHVQKWKIKSVDLDVNFSFTSNNSLISEVLDKLCENIGAIAVIDETGLIIIPNSIFLDKDKYENISKQIYYKKIK